MQLWGPWVDLGPEPPWGVMGKFRNFDTLEKSEIQISKEMCDPQRKKNLNFEIIA